MPAWVPPKSKRSGQSTVVAVRDATVMLSRVALTFVAITLGVALAGLIFYAIRRRGLPLGSATGWIVRLTPLQMISLVGGILVAAFLIGTACSAISRRDSGQPLAGRFLRQLVVLSALLIYLVGARCAFNVSHNVAKSPDWAPIHSLYSWAYVGFSFAGFAEEHSKQPFQKTVRQFWGMMNS